MLACRQLHTPASADFLEHVHVFFSHYHGWWTNGNFGAIFYRTSSISGPSNTSSSQQKLNLLEHFSRLLDDSLNVLSIFLSKCEELNIPETLTTKFRRLLEELHSIHTRIFNIIINEHGFVLNSNHPCFLLSAEPTYTGPGRPRLEISAVEIIWLYDVKL